MAATEHIHHGQLCAMDNHSMRWIKWFAARGNQNHGITQFPACYYIEANAQKKVAKLKTKLEKSTHFYISLSFFPHNSFIPEIYIRVMLLTVPNNKDRMQPLLVQDEHLRADHISSIQISGERTQRNLFRRKNWSIILKVACLSLNDNHQFVTKVQLKSWA